jgi:hypothetical protein
MTKNEIIQMIDDRSELADRAFNSWQQLKGQLALLRELLKSANEEELKNLQDKKDKKEDGENKSEQ